MEDNKLKTHPVSILVKFTSDVPYVQINLLVPDMFDDEEYILDFLEAVVGEERVYDVQWDFAF